MDHPATEPYQTFDPLTPEEFAALEADVLERGVLVPIEFDEDGNVLDGHHRKRICDKHGITDYPSVVRKGLTEKEKRAHARKLNLARRHLTHEQKQRQIEQALREDAGDSDRKIASALNVDHKTVGAARARLVESGEIPQPVQRIGVNGMAYVSPPKPVLRDAEGGEVPQRLQKLFSTRPEHQRLVNELREIKRRCLDLAQVNPVLRSHEATVRQQLDRLIDVLTAGVCHAIHSGCQGAGCESCGGRGFTTGGEILQRNQGRCE